MNSKFYLRSIVWLFLLTCMNQISFAQIPLDGLVGYYMMDGNVADSSGMAHDGLTVNSVVSVENRFGQADKAYSLVDGYIDCGNPVAYQLTNSISVSVWINLNVIGIWPPILSKWAGFGIGGYYLGVSPYSNSVVWNLDSPSPIEGNPMATEEWIHIVASLDGDSVKVFQNGSLVNSQAYSDTIVNTSASFLIGSQYDYTDLAVFDGSVDDVLVYNRGLTEAEVEQIYGVQITSTANLFANHSVDVFPNPTNDVLNIQNNSEHPILSYSLFSASGQLIKKAAFQENLDLSAQPSGLYYLLLDFEDISTTKKIIKE